MLLMCCIIFTSILAVSRYKVVCYHTNWSRYRVQPAQFKISDIDPFLCTHLIYAFGIFDDDGFLTPHEGTSEYSRYVEFNELKLQNSNLKTLIAIGGWNFGSTKFSTMANDETKRSNFVSSAVAMLRDYGFDGLDIDWEYPAQRGGQNYDKTNLIVLCEELSIAFDAESVQSGKNRLLLTAAVPASRTYVQYGYDVPELNKYLDFFNLMTYDYHGGWDGKTGHNSPLYASSQDTGDEKYLNTNDTASYWHQAGVMKEKVIVGLATYGRTFSLSNPSSFGVGAPASVGLGGKYTGETGFKAYYEICKEIQNGDTGQVVFDNDMQVPYYVNNDVWIGYDNERSLKIKAQMIADNNYGGMMVWSLALDDFRKTSPLCSSTTRRFPLIKAASDILNPPADGSVTPSVNESDTISTPSSTPSPTTSTATTPSNDQQAFSCVGKVNGHYKDPASCTSFYVCENNISHQHNCPTDLQYDESITACNWPSVVKCV